MIILCANREDWLAGRRTGIGSSDAPVLWGCGYSGSSLLSMFAEKVHGVEKEFDWNTQALMRMGSAAEPLIREWFERETGLRVATDPPHSYRSCMSHPFMLASLDAYTADADDNFVVLELKRIGRHARKQWGESDVPLKYAVQLQHQLLVTGAPYGYVVASCEERELLIRRCERDEAFIAAHIEKCRWFWEMVQAKEYTGPVDGSPGSTEAVARLSPTAVLGKSVELGIEADDLVQRIARLKDVIADASKDMDAAKNQLKLLIGDAESATCPNGTAITYKNKSARGYFVPAKTYRELRIKESDE